MTITKQEVQEIFTVDVDELLNAEVDTLNYIEQNHYGDFLIDESEAGDERFKLWANYDGEDITGIEVEYFGRLNSYKWETVFEM